MNDGEQRADTEWNGTNRRRSADDCDAGTHALHLLVGNPHKPEAQSVFARLGAIERKIGMIGALLVLPLWVLAVLATLDRIAR
jgi:hypothetical protein